MRAPIFKNERTMASAGSGKTYALTNRFIALMLGGANPEEICALTFTRKAAGEFFEKTITKLADAGGDENFARALSAQMRLISNGLENCGSQKFLETLKKFVKSAPRLHMETIDAFASRYVRFFASELGLGYEITVMDDFAQEKMKAQTIARALSVFAKDSSAFAQFAESFRIANMGHESKSVLKDLNGFIDAAHGIFINNPDSVFWGNSKAFGRKKLVHWNPEQYGELLASLKEAFETATDKNEAKACAYILGFFQKARPKGIPAPSNKAVKALAEYVSENKSAHGFSIPSSRGNDSYPISENASATIDALLAMLIEGDIALSCESLKAIWLIVSIYERLYSENVRRKGLLSFADMPLAIAYSGFEREIIEYRFDSSFSHWLFDEFQDTSRLQWNIFENLIEEAVLNSENEKTFYYVGDVKQSIYSWRGGDPKLFDEIKEKFGDEITDNPQIKTSWRSSPPVINAVNKLFGDARTLELHFGKTAAKRWGEIWQDHDVAQKHLSMPGCVSMQGYDEDMPEAVYRHIRDTKPLQRGLSCAVLTRRNSTAEKIVEHIRRRSAEDNLDIRAAGELEVKIASDNMAVPALLAFANAAFHPADTLSREYALMTPLKEYAGENPDKAFEKFLGEAQAFGFAQAFAVPSKFLAQQAGNSFTQTRIGQFLEMAEIFDAESERDCDAFTSFARKYKIREGAASDTIQVMSVHKSKGLDFDIVILPELEKTASPGGLQISVLADGNVVRKPSKAAAEFDGSLRKMRAEIDNESAFESLCLYYVALTRAKNAMHIVLKNRKAPASADCNMDFARLFCDIFGDPEDKLKTLEGNEDWASIFPLIQDGGAKTHDKPVFTFNETEKTLCDAPQGLTDFSCTDTGKILGSCIHSIFEKLSEFDCDIDAAKRSVSYLYADDANILDEAYRLVQKAMRNADISKIFEAKNYWAEKPFSIFTPSGLQSGRFDRVNFYPEECRAEIIDFKTRSNTDNAEHKEQLLRYRTALQKICGIENIGLTLLSVADAKTIRI